MDDQMESEFDTVATWTERVVQDLGSEYAIPAACRGSGSPAWLRWLADGLALETHERFLDAGAGIGGPAAWLRERSGMQPVLAEPMEGACASARRLFGLPTTVAWSEALPFKDEAFDAAWLLGVLCTTTKKHELLSELRRVLTANGRLGVLVLVQVVDELVNPPDGNEFPTPDSLREDLEAAGFSVQGRVKPSELPDADERWSQRADRVEEALSTRYAGKEAWETAQEQEKRIGRLLRAGDLETWLLCARVT